MDKIIKEMSLNDKLFYGGIGFAGVSANIIIYILISATLGPGGTFTLFHPWWFLIQFLINVFIVSAIIIGVTIDDRGV